MYGEHETTEFLVTFRRCGALCEQKKSEKQPQYFSTMVEWKQKNTKQFI